MGTPTLSRWPSLSFLPSSPSSTLNPAQLEPVLVLKPAVRSLVDNGDAVHTQTLTAVLTTLTAAQADTPVISLKEPANKEVLASMLTTKPPPWLSKRLSLKLELAQLEPVLVLKPVAPFLGDNGDAVHTQTLTAVLTTLTAAQADTPAISLKEPANKEELALTSKRRNSHFKRSLPKLELAQLEPALPLKPVVNSLVDNMAAAHMPTLTAVLITLTAAQMVTLAISPRDNALNKPEDVLVPVKHTSD